MTRRSFSLAAALLLALPALPANALEPLTREVVSLAQADAMIDAAVADARTRGIQVSVVIVDSAGDMVAAHRMDGSGAVFFEIARRKAYTSAVFRTASSNIETNVVTGLQGSGKFWGSMVLDDVMPRQGGLPVTSDGAVIGAIGISGGTPDVDEMIAQAGLAALE